VRRTWRKGGGRFKDVLVMRRPMALRCLESIHEYPSKTPPISSKKHSVASRVTTTGHEKGEAHPPGWMIELRSGFHFES